MEVINLQDRVNGLDWIANKFAGKTCVDLDIDRQVVTYSGSPDQIDKHIGESVAKIGRKEGGANDDLRALSRYSIEECRGGYESHKEIFPAL